MAQVMRSWCFLNVSLSVVLKYRLDYRIKLYAAFSPQTLTLNTFHTRTGCLFCIKHMETPFHRSDMLATSVWMNRSSYSWTTRCTAVCRDNPTFATLGMLRSVCRTPAAKTGGSWMSGRWRVVWGELKIGKYLDQGRKYNICHHVSLKIHQCSARSAISGGFDLTMKLDVCTLR